MFPVPNLLIAVWVGGTLSVIGNFRKGKVWLIPTLVILSVNLLDDALHFALARLPESLFNQPERADPIKELIRRILSFAVTLGLIFLISSNL